MTSVPGKAADRLAAGIKRFQPILAAAKTRDLNESDTVTIITDMLSDVFGYDKYSEVTSEYAIRNTFVDLAIKIDGALQLLVEVKAIGLELKDGFIRQAVDYAANQGIEWVILTNGAVWRVYNVHFTKPIDQELVLEIDFQKLGPKNKSDIEALFLLTREGQAKSLLGEYRVQRDALNRFSMAAMLLSDTVVDVLRREMRRLSPGIRIEADEIRSVLTQEVLKREVVEGEKAEEARRKVGRAANRPLRSKTGGRRDGDGADDESEVAVDASTESTDTGQSSPDPA